MQDTLLEDIDRIEVVRGPGAIWAPTPSTASSTSSPRTPATRRGMLVSAGGGTYDRASSTGATAEGATSSPTDLRQRLHPRTPVSPGRSQFRRPAHGPGGFPRGLDPESARLASRSRADTYSTDAGQRLGISRFFPPALEDTQGNNPFFRAERDGRLAAGAARFEHPAAEFLPTAPTARTELPRGSPRLGHRFLHQKPFERQPSVGGPGRA